MNKLNYVRVTFIILIVFLTGCVGNDNILFVTKTSFAVDLDTNPPTLDIGYGRYEGSIGPVVESGEVLPLMSSVSIDAGISSTVFGSGVAQNFGVGNAAIILTKYIGSTENPSDINSPTFASIIDSPASIEGTLLNSRRYFFGTKTSLGFTTSFAAERGFSPDSISLGYKRKEIAYVPIQEKSEISTDTNGFILNNEGAKISINGQEVTEDTFKSLTTTEQQSVLSQADSRKVLSIPSLIATAGTKSEAGIDQTGFAVNQFYATGMASNYLAAHPLVRNSIVSAITSDDDLDAQLKAELFQSTSEELDSAIDKSELARLQAWEYIDSLGDDTALNTALSSLITVEIVQNNTTFTAGSDIASKKIQLKRITDPVSNVELSQKVSIWVRNRK